MRHRMLAALIAGSCSLVVLAAAGLAAPEQATELRGVVGPGPTITLTTADGTTVRRLDPGSYTVAVDDRSDSHNFHLMGPGVDQRTAVDFVGQTTWSVQLGAGSYTYLCDPHSTTMRGSFSVGAASQPQPAARPLAAVVGPGKKLTLRTGAGKRVKTLAAGRYRITVRDRSAKDNVHLIGPGVNRRTGIKFRGSTTWRVTLRAGTYRYRSDATRKLRGSFRVVARGASAHPGHG